MTLFKTRIHRTDAHQNCAQLFVNIYVSQYVCMHTNFISFWHICELNQTIPFYVSVVYKRDILFFLKILHILYYFTQTECHFCKRKKPLLCNICRNWQSCNKRWKSIKEMQLVTLVQIALTLFLQADVIFQQADVLYNRIQLFRVQDKLLNFSQRYCS